jgi:TRAP-type C4-dicarboxylate transport system permease small subunit
MEDNKNNTLKWFFGHFEEVSCAVLFAIMTLIAFGNIVTRHLFKYSFAFTEELVVSLFVWLTLFGAGIAFRTGSHLGFTLLFERLPIKLRKIQIWCFCALSVFLFLTLVYFSVKQVHFEMVFDIRSMGVGIPQWYYTIGMPVWSVLVICRIFQGSHLASKALGGE